MMMVLSGFSLSTTYWRQGRAEKVDNLGRHRCFFEKLKFFQIKFFCMSDRVTHSKRKSIDIECSAADCCPICLDSNKYGIQCMCAQCMDKHTCGNHRQPIQIHLLFHSGPISLYICGHVFKMKARAPSSQAHFGGFSALDKRV